ncbi:MAG: response regulator [Deltaproteobacteria bacterium]|nr:response regulator [Deltaproteobacteria bacterium]
MDDQGETAPTTHRLAPSLIPMDRAGPQFGQALTAQILLDEGMKVQGCSASAALLFGRDRGTMQGAEFREFFPPEEWNRMQRQWPGPAGEPAIHQWRGTAWGSGRKSFLAELTLYALVTGETLVQIGGVEVDHEHHRLAHLEKLATLGQTVAGVAHEVNNPLTTVIAHAQLALENPQRPDVRPRLETILREARRMAKILRGLLTFAREKPREHVRVVIPEIIEATLALRAHEHRLTNIRVIRELSDDLPPVAGDPDQLQQVLLNLFMNAEQAMLEAHGNGRLIIRAYVEPTTSGVRLEIEDNGPGIPPEVQDRIFEPFFTTKGPGKGTGLGLAIVRSIVQSHGGSIELRGQPDQGAVFVITLPPHAGLQGAAETVMPSTDEGLPQILIVDDEPELAAVLSEALQKEGYRVDMASSGPQALEAIARKSYRAIISDYKMPGMNGRMLHGVVSGRQPQLARRILFTTGDSSEEVLQFIEECGNLLLLKPFPLEELSEALRSLLARS